MSRRGSDAYRLVLERANAGLSLGKDKPSSAVDSRTSSPSSRFVDKGERYADASDWALSEGFISEQEGDLLVVDGTAIRGGSLEQAKDYLRGELHGNFDFPGRDALRSLLHRSYRRQKTPAKLPFRVNKKQRSVAALVQKRTKRELNQWIDSLSHEQMQELTKLVEKKS